MEKSPERTTSLAKNARLLLIAIAIIIATFFITAQSGKLKPLPEGQMPSPGLTPRNPFYFIDIITERSLMLFAITKETKYQLAERFAQEKFAEILHLQSHPYGFYIGEVITYGAVKTARDQYEYYKKIAGLPAESIEIIPPASEEEAAEPALPPATTTAPTSTPSAETATGSPSYKPSSLFAAVSETADRFLNEPLPPFDALVAKFYQRLPPAIQEKLDSLAASFGKPYNQIKTWLYEKLNSAKIYLSERVKIKANDFIDRLFGTKQDEQ